MVTKLADYIRREGLTQAAFARRAGLPSPMISLWAGAKRRPCLKSALAIEKATGGKVPAAYWPTVVAENDRRSSKQHRS